MRVHKLLMPVVVLVAFLGSIVLAKATGQWIVSGKQMIDMENLTSVSEIRGWMTLEQVTYGFGMPADELYGTLAIPADVPLDTALKDLERLVPGFEVSAVRATVAEFIGEAYEAPEVHDEEATSQAQPTPVATAAPEATPKATEHIPSGGGAGGGTGTGPTPLPEGVVMSGADVKGRHSLQEVADGAAVDLEALLAALELASDTDVDRPLKDLVASGELAGVQDVRDAVTALQQ